MSSDTREDVRADAVAFWLYMRDHPMPEGHVYGTTREDRAPYRALAEEMLAYAADAVDDYDVIAAMRKLRPKRERKPRTPPPKANPATSGDTV